jgi:hypothetical protein
MVQGKGGVHRRSELTADPAPDLIAFVILGRCRCSQQALRRAIERLILQMVASDNDNGTVARGLSVSLRILKLTAPRTLDYATSKNAAAGAG